MTNFRKILFCTLLTSAVWTVNGDSTFVGSSVSSDPSGTRSVLVSGRNGVVQTRIGGSPTVVQTRIGGGPVLTTTGSGATGSVGTFASAGGASAYAGPGGAYAGPGPWGFPYWNGGGSYASAGAGAPYPYNYPPPYPYDPYYYNGDYGTNDYSVYSGSDSNGIQTRFANVAPGGQATIVEQTGNEEPKVYTYRGKDIVTVEKVEP